MGWFLMLWTAPMSGFSSFFFSEQMLLVCKLWNSKVTLSNQGEDAPVRVKYCVSSSQNRLEV